MKFPPLRRWWGVNADGAAEQMRALPTQLCFTKVSLNSFSNTLGMHGDIDML